jgi:hypothetical protein
MYQLAASHKSKDVRKNAHKLLRNTLRCMCRVYVTEQRAFSGVVWSETTQWKHWQQWGRWDEVEGG